MLSNALIYLFAAVLSVPIAKRLGLGSVLGYLLAGVIIGPFVLQLVGDQTDIMHFAEFGVVMMLFLIGLELKPARLWEMRHPILGLGGLQVVITSLVIATALFFIIDIQLKTSIAIGLTLALSSTAIVMQSLSEKGLIKTPAGENAFAVLLFQDIAVIPILAIFPLLAIGEVMHSSTQHTANLISHHPIWLQVIISLLAIISIVIVGKFLSSPIFRFIAETRLREVFTAFSLLIVVMNAALMQSIGLSPALGAFLAGVVLAESEFRHELDVDIAPFKGLLLGLFFITVGASINFNLIIDAPLVIVTGVVSLILVKALVLLFLAYIFKLKMKQGLLFTVALAQGGEFAFVLVSTAKQFSVFDSDIGNLITVIVALSMLISPLLIIIYEKIIPNDVEGSESEQHDSNITSSESAIIIGYGRFGQIVGRLLNSQNYNITLLDYSSSQIDMAKSFGYKVFYGDGSRHDLLEAAGASSATLLVVAVDNANKSLEIVKTVQKNFPQIKIVARATDRTHAYKLMDLKIEAFHRETFQSAIALGKDALVALGKDRGEAEKAGEVFKRYDERSLELLSEHWGDDKKYGSASKENVEALFNILQEDKSMKG